MRPTTIIGIVLTLAIFAGLGYGLHWANVNYENNKDVILHQVYEGRVYLTSEEYEEFKKFLADHPSARIHELDVLSSENPLIDFRITTLDGLHFPWGELEGTYYAASEGGRVAQRVLMIFGAIAALAVAWVVVWRIEEVVDGGVT